MKWIALVVALVLALPAQADRRQFANILYDMPEDWREGRERDGVKTLYPDLPGDRCETCYFYFTNGGPRRGSLADFMREEARRFVDPDRHRNIELVGQADPIDLGAHSARMQVFKVSTDIYIMTGFELSDRFEVVAFKASGRTRERSREAADVANEYITPMLAGIEFVSEGAEPLLPQARRGDMDGVYWGYRMQVAVGAGGMGTLAPSYQTLIFWPDGHFYDGIPPDGLNPLDREALIATGNTSFGIYHERRRRIELTYADGRSAVMQRDGRNWVLNDRELARVEPLEDGTRLDGTITIRHFGGFTVGSGLSGSTMASAVTRFSPDGTFGASTAVGSSGGFDSGGGFAGSSRSSSEGRYEIRDGLLILHPADGSQAAPRLIFRANGDTYIDDTPLQD